MTAYRDSTETLLARIATLEAENAALRPAPVGPMRWKFDFFQRIEGWQVLFWNMTCFIVLLFSGWWHAAVVLVSTGLFCLTCIRKVPR